MARKSSLKGAGNTFSRNAKWSGQGIVGEGELIVKPSLRLHWVLAVASFWGGVSCFAFLIASFGWSSALSG